MNDPTPARDGEGRFGWVRRSTLPSAKAARDFLNRQLAQMPSLLAEHLTRRLQTHWDSTFFELVVARTVQELGAEIEFEEPNESGRRPDYRATFSDGVVTVEAVSPEFDQEMRDEWESVAALWPFVRQAVPSGWAALIDELPPLGPADSKRELRQALTGLMPEDSPSGAEDCRQVETMLSSGRLALTLMPRVSEETIIGGPGIGGGDNSSDRIRTAVRRKRRQVRGGPHPVLLAINAGGSSSTFESFDQALFGTTCVVVRDRRVVGRKIKWDGSFMRPNDAPPTYAGVLGFLQVGYRYRVDPVLYLHPRFSGVLPERLREMETRTASREFGFHTHPALHPRFLERLGFVPEEI